MKLVAIPSWKEGNGLWPLPPDYHDLTGDGQRLARINACRQWRVPTLDPHLKAGRFIGSMLFFERHYLWPDEAEDFDPMFFDEKPIPTPEGHLLICREWAIRKSSLSIAPRGFAKSTLIKKAILLQAISSPVFWITYATSSAEAAHGVGETFKFQVTNNERILRDWCPEYGGSLRPARGEASFGVERAHLTNGSWLRCISAEGRSRGGRPRIFYLDDPEHDPKASTQMTVLRAGTANLLFKVIRPMVTRRGTALRWLATIISKRHYAWSAMETKDTPDGPRAVDPRFDHWSRLVLDAEYEEGGVRRSCWPEMWPIDNATRDANPELAGTTTLEELEREMGRGVYLAEMRARPGEGEDAYFPTLREESHGWWVTDVDEHWNREPWRSTTLLHWHDPQGVPRQMEIAAFLAGECRLFMTVDTSFTNNATSDPKAVVLMAITPLNQLFVLDCWARRTSQDILIREVLSMADRWRCPVVAVEVVRESNNLFHDLDAVVRQRAMSSFGVTHLPAIRPLRVGMLDKPTKISGLRYRFDHSLIKFSLRSRHDRSWGDLFDQIEGFNPEVADGGLSNDDLIDCVAMSNLVVKWRLPTRVTETVPEESPLEKVASGQLTDERTGIPNLAFVDWSRIPVSSLLEALSGVANEHARTDDGQPRSFV